MDITNFVDTLKTEAANPQALVIYGVVAALAAYAGYRLAK